MCGRFTITRRDGNMLAAELGVAADSFVDYRPRYNVAPTQMHYVVRVKFENREVLPARWGLVNTWAKDASTAAKNINARRDRREAAHLSRGLRQAAMRRAGRRIFRMDRSEGVAPADLVPSRGQPITALRRF